MVLYNLGLRQIPLAQSLGRIDVLDLHGQLAVITGAGGGIGRELVRTFLQAGAKVVACDIDASRMEGLNGVERVAFDLTDVSACEAAARQIEGIGPIDILINNAGGSRADTFDQVSDNMWRTEIDLNLNGARHFTDRVLPGMRRRRAGTIVFIATVNASAHFGNPAYSAAKAGLVAYCKALAVEYGRDGIRANYVSPGSVITSAWDGRLAANPKLLDKVNSFYPLGRTVTVSEVSLATLFLASNLASGITGTELLVDAGLTAGNLAFVNSVFRNQ